MWNERLVSNVRQNDDGYEFLLLVRIDKTQIKNLTSSALFEGFDWDQSDIFGYFGSWNYEFFKIIK